MKKIAIASYNKGKIKEIEKYFDNTIYKAISPQSLGIIIDTLEDGGSFINNAIIKAKAFGKISKITTIADDSGLCIDYLDGGPGVDSALFLGADTSYEKRFEYILNKMEKAKGEDRAARFVCCIAIYTVDKKIYTLEANMEGEIATEPKGSYGFGYDSIFYIPKYGKTFAELNIEEKNKISHRGKALNLLIKKLDEIL